MANNAHDVLVELLRKDTRAEEPGGQTPTPAEWAVHMDSIAARAIAFDDTNVSIDDDICATTANDTNDCTAPNDLPRTTEGTDDAMTAPLPPYQGHQSRVIGLCLLAAVAAGVTAWLFATVAAPIGAVTGSLTALGAIIVVLGRSGWFPGLARRDQSAREGLVPRSQ
ncbi:hypothetical protein [Streptomyces canus]|uniref:hypothetical protein n=1 Tax=Streptomyces canus TaxID=58343 RepID=UPI00036E0477|nr:hypothetical protein [Streptomyces canus]